MSDHQAVILTTRQSTTRCQKSEFFGYISINANHEADRDCRPRQFQANRDFGQD